MIRMLSPFSPGMILTAKGPTLYPEGDLGNLNY